MGPITDLSTRMAHPKPKDVQLYQNHGLCPRAPHLLGEAGYALWEGRSNSAIKTRLPAKKRAKKIWKTQIKVLETGEMGDSLPF